MRLKLKPFFLKLTGECTVLIFIAVQKNALLPVKNFQKLQTERKVLKFCRGKPLNALVFCVLFPVFIIFIKKLNEGINIANEAALKYIEHVKDIAQKEENLKKLKSIFQK